MPNIFAHSVVWCNRRTLRTNNLSMVSVRTVRLGSHKGLMIVTNLFDKIATYIFIFKWHKRFFNIFLSYQVQYLHLFLIHYETFDLSLDSSCYL